MREDKTLISQFFPDVHFGLDEIRKVVEGRTPLREKISTSVQLPLAPASKRVLAYANEESDRLQHHRIGMEHIVFGLMREEQAIAFKILRGYGIKYDRALIKNYDLSACIDAASLNGALVLDFSKWGLAELPNSFRLLPQLQRLYLSDNKLTALPKAIGQLPQLDVLDLSNNWLGSLPDYIGQLTQLDQLYLSHNQLCELPESIGQLTRLRYLDLSYNKLIELPESLKNLRLLNTLDLRENKELGIPAEVLGIPSEEDESKKTPPAKILDYYFRAKFSQRPLNEAKLILVGRGAVGKTSIVNRLVHSLF